ncbi:unnamed protein product [Lactuca saligna]|uniref:Uncharacterized protein n=1 Tax=Lactuca saligna TaxID=75948 RepID=A0AA35ZA53_LACSI|nr:unnamed protein product [Lactuca saligna]
MHATFQDDMLKPFIFIHVLEVIKKSIRWKELVTHEDIANLPKRSRTSSYSSSQQISLNVHIDVDLNDDKDDIEEIRLPPHPMRKDKAKVRAKEKRTKAKMVWENTMMAAITNKKDGLSKTRCSYLMSIFGFLGRGEGGDRRITVSYPPDLAIVVEFVLIVTMERSVLVKIIPTYTKIDFRFRVHIRN